MKSLWPYIAALALLAGLMAARTRRARLEATVNDAGAVDSWDRLLYDMRAKDETDAEIQPSGKLVEWGPTPMPGQTLRDPPSTTGNLQLANLQPLTVEPNKVSA